MIKHGPFNGDCSRKLIYPILFLEPCDLLFGVSLICPYEVHVVAIHSIDVVLRVEPSDTFHTHPKLRVLIFVALCVFVWITPTLVKKRPRTIEVLVSCFSVIALELLIAHFCEADHCVIFR